MVRVNHVATIQLLDGCLPYQVIVDWIGRCPPISQCWSRSWSRVARSSHLAVEQKESSCGRAAPGGGFEILDLLQVKLGR